MDKPDIDGLKAFAARSDRDTAEFFVGRPGTSRHLTETMRERWESLGPEAFGTIRGNETVPQEAVTATVSLDGVMALPDPSRTGALRNQLALEVAHIGRVRPDIVAADVAIDN